MTEKRVSLRGLAKFMTAGEAERLRTLREFKYPNDAGAAAMRHYYVPATEAIVLYHAGGREEEWLRQQAAGLEAGAAAASKEGQRRKLRSNAAALRNYARYFANRAFAEARRGPRWKLQYGDVIISVRPDLQVVERGVEKVVRLGFPGANDRAIKVMAQGLLEAATRTVGFVSSQVLYFDLRSGDVAKGRAGARLAKDIAAACRTISALWDSITRTD